MDDAWIAAAVRLENIEMNEKRDIPLNTYMEYEKFIQAFNASCHLYKIELKESEDLRKRKNLDPVVKKTLSFLEEDMKYVNYCFDIIKEKCGTNTALIMWLSLVEEKTYKDLIAKFGLSSKTIAKILEEGRIKLYEALYVETNDEGEEE